MFYVRKFGSPGSCIKQVKDLSHLKQYMIRYTLDVTYITWTYTIWDFYKVMVPLLPDTHLCVFTCVCSYVFMFEGKI